MVGGIEDTLGSTEVLLKATPENIRDDDGDDPLDRVLIAMNLEEDDDFAQTQIVRKSLSKGVGRNSSQLALGVTHKPGSPLRGGNLTSKNFISSGDF